VELHHLVLSHTHLYHVDYSVKYLVDLLAEMEYNMNKYVFFSVPENKNRHVVITLGMSH